MGDKISNLIKAHGNAIEAAIQWTEAVVRRHKTEKPYARYYLAEKRFDIALGKLQEDIVRNPEKYR